MKLPTIPSIPTIPFDFGGFIGHWYEGKAYLVRYGEGKPIEGVGLTPLNILQARKTLDALIEQGRREGYITPEHERQSERLPHTEIANVMLRKQVDDIAGPD